MRKPKKIALPSRLQARRDFEERLEKGIHIDINSHNSNPKRRTKSAATKKGATKKPRQVEAQISRQAALATAYIRETARAAKAAMEPMKLSGLDAKLTKQARISYAEGMLMAGYILKIFTPDQRKEALQVLKQSM